MNETTQSALLYAKFRSTATALRTVVREIELRSHHHDEYASLLNECYQAYFGIRLRLITPIIMTQMAEISGNKDIVPYVLPSKQSSLKASVVQPSPSSEVYVQMNTTCSSSSSRQVKRNSSTLPPSASLTPVSIYPT
jgi:hypothetical protein